MNNMGFQYDFQHRGLFVFVLLLVFVTGALAEPDDGNISAELWDFICQRAEIAPVAFVDPNTRYMDQPTLALAGGGKFYCNGGWTVMVPVESGQYYQFTSHYMTRNVDEPHRSVLARLTWVSDHDMVLGTTEYPAVWQSSNSSVWMTIDQTYLVPEGATAAVLELIYRWDADGTVRFGNTSLTRTTKPAPRYVRLASIDRWPHENGGTLPAVLKEFDNLVAQAAAQKADIVCLPEALNVAGLSIGYVEGAETIPGPTTEYLGNIAAHNNLYIVAGLMERDGEVVYNSAVLLDRQGKLVGKYRKVSLPREEIEGGVTPGDHYPVFDTDFGKIAMLICWDITFPEAVKSVALQGAEVVLMPIAGGDTILAKSRALENQVYLVTSGYDMVTAVFDHRGAILKQAGDDEAVIVQQVDLDQHYYWPWVGDFKNRMVREMPTKKAIVTEPDW